MSIDEQVIAALVERGEEQGCINLSALTKLIEYRQLDDEDV
jgi:hypothetical protein